MTDGLLLDTNAISAAIRGRDGVRAHLRSIHQSRLRTAAVVIAELEYGSLKAPEPDLYRTRWRRFLDGIPVLPFNEAAALHHAGLRLILRQNPIGERDLLIAAIALAHGLGVVTANLREFTRVAGLRVEDWSS